MKVLNYFSILLLFAMAIGLSSCGKEEINTTEVISEPVTPTEENVNGLVLRSVSSTDGLDLGCVSIDYPFQLTLIDGTVIDITSSDDFIAALEDVDNPVLDFVYPLSVTDEDDNSSTVENADELGELFINCIPDSGWSDTGDWFFPAWDITFDNSCYELVYPLDLLDMDSMTVTAADSDALLSLLSDGNVYSFTFPLQLEDEDGNAVSADDAEDLFDLLADCGPGAGSGGSGIGTFACYEFGFPVDLVMLDGTTQTVNDEDEFTAAFLGGEVVAFGFPINIIDEDDNTITINNDDELSAAILECDGFGGGTGGGNGGGSGGGDPDFIYGDFLCYDFVYPIEVETPMGGILTINNSEEWMDSQIAGISIDGFVYPIDLVDTESGDQSTVGSIEELIEAMEDCF